MTEKIIVVRVRVKGDARRVRAFHKIREAIEKIQEELGFEIIKLDIEEGKINGTNVSKFR